MTEPSNFRPRWAVKLVKDTKIEPEVWVMYKVVGVILVVLIIWTIAARL
ncbi:hypothetical protein [Brevundimonas sp.]|nr:hypothetical protein [Brevundimonas sp.]HWQ86771.1 hypothetical protein [Brevundimonas sp.]